MSNLFTVTRTINGKDYTAQFNGVGAALEANDTTYIDGTNTASMEKLAKYLFKHVIIEPKLSLEDFGADKIGTTETKVINGKEYTAKFNGILTALRATDESYVDGTNSVSTVKLAEFMFKNVIVAPEGLTADDFADMDDFNEVIAFAREVMQGHEVMEEFTKIFRFAREVMQGHFREEANKGATKAKSKE